MSSKITRKRNTPLPGLLVLAVGIAMWVLLRTTKLGDNLSTTCLTIGLIATVLGIILTAMNLSGAMTHYVYLPTHSNMKKKNVYICGDDYKDITEAITNGNLQPLANISPVVSSNSAVRILASRDGECVLVQAIRDQSGHFEAETDVRVLTGTAAAAIQHLLK